MRACVHASPLPCPHTPSPLHTYLTPQPPTPPPPTHARRYSDDLSVRGLLERFETLLSPLKVHTPALLESAAAHAAFQAGGRR